MGDKLEIYTASQYEQLQRELDDANAFRYHITGIEVHELTTKIEQLQRDLKAAQTGEPGTPLGRWKGLHAWAETQDWYQKYSARGMEGQLIKHVEQLKSDAHKWLTYTMHKDGAEFTETINKLQRELTLYKSLAICECGEQAEYPAHGWMPNICPACQAEALK